MSAAGKIIRRSPFECGEGVMSPAKTGGSWDRPLEWSSPCLEIPYLAASGPAFKTFPYRFVVACDEGHYRTYEQYGLRMLHGRSASLNNLQGDNLAAS